MYVCEFWRKRQSSCIRCSQAKHRSLLIEFQFSIIKSFNREFAASIRAKKSMRNHQKCEKALKLYVRLYIWVRLIANIINWSSNMPRGIRLDLVECVCSMKTSMPTCMPEIVCTGAEQSSGPAAANKLKTTIIHSGIRHLPSARLSGCLPSNLLITTRLCCIHISVDWIPWKTSRSMHSAERYLICSQRRKGATDYSDSRCPANNVLANLIASSWFSHIAVDARISRQTDLSAAWPLLFSRRFNLPLPVGRAEAGVKAKAPEKHYWFRKQWANCQQVNGLPFFYLISNRIKLIAENQRKYVQ